jgi:hypothetical protein
VHVQATAAGQDPAVSSRYCLWPQQNRYFRGRPHGHAS